MPAELFAMIYPSINSEAINIILTWHRASTLGRIELHQSVEGTILVFSWLRTVCQHQIVALAHPYMIQTSQATLFLQQQRQAFTDQAAGGL